MISSLFKTFYVLRRYHVLGAPAARWFVVLLLIAALLVILGLLPGGSAGALFCLTLLLALLAGQRLAERRQYVHFRPHESAIQSLPGAAPLHPAAKLSLRATGLFEVEGKTQSFSELPAIYRSFSTREHALLAAVAPSRRLAGLAEWPPHEIGMWYIFIKSNELRQVQPGTLQFGRARRPALRLQVEQLQPGKNTLLDAWGLQWGSNQPKPTTRQQAIYLSFDSEMAREQVMKDLLADTGV